MDNSDSSLHQQLLSRLTAQGPATSAELQAVSGKSQPTLSRALKSLGGQLVTLGQGKRTRYGVPKPINGLPSQQPLWWTDPSGHVSRLGTLTLLSGDQVHVGAEGIDELARGRLPWFLAPLRLQGFLGREWAKQLRLDGNPEQWSVEQVLYAALQVDDHPGAISIGEPRQTAAPLEPQNLNERAKRYDALALDVTATLPAGSSAGGEQSKFLVALESGEQLIVKFTPPRGTPFGERWHDLLHAEWLALVVLAEQGIAVAPAQVIESSARTYLESTRFDRIAPHGRRHAVALDAIHEAFVPGPRQHWVATCESLAAQRKLSAGDVTTVRTVFEFGRLIGNSDMHFGNLSLWADDVTQPKFALAPVYDMLPMRWRPDAFSGSLDYTPFEPQRPAHGSAAVPLAQGYWKRLSRHAPVSRAMRELARDMAERLAR